MVVDRIKLAHLVQIHHGGVVENRIEMELVELDFRCVPVHRIAFEHELVVRHPGLYLEWTTRDDVFRLRPLVALLLDDFARHEYGRPDAQASLKRTAPVGQGDPHGVLVDSFDAEILGLNWDELFARHRRFQLCDLPRVALCAPSHRPEASIATANAFDGETRCPDRESISFGSGRYSLFAGSIGLLPNRFGGGFSSKISC